MSGRKAAVEETRARILEATYLLWLELPYDALTVAAVARRAEVTRQTVIRHFGSKEALILAAAAWQQPREEAARRVEPGDVRGAVTRLVERYDLSGDANVRLLELEGRSPTVAEMLRRGRKSHRRWLAETFAPQLEGLARRDKRLTVDALYAATDVMNWKLLRRDFGRSSADTEAVLLRLVEGALVSEKGDAR
ncbi:MAG: helix-turn-helix domain-containing protein [Sandaracinaceae bacterium]